MQIHLNFVTPLWTGDASKQAQRVVGTGLLGSLRWWYEAMIRGLDGWACDPTDDHHRCQLNANGFKAALERGCPHLGKGKLCPTCEAQALSANGLCATCQLFGATGWAKTITVALQDETISEYPPTGSGQVKTTGGRLNLKKEPSAWYFYEGRGQSVSLSVVPRRVDDTLSESVYLGLLEFIRRNAALGAKNALGYGLFEWGEPVDALATASGFAQALADRAAIGRVGHKERWPDLREMFFAQMDLKKDWTHSDFVNFKYDLRQAFHSSAITPKLRHFLLGDIRNEPHQASKIKMALWSDQSVLQIWGWIPQQLPEAQGKTTRAALINLLRTEIVKVGTISYWRQFDSPLDTKAHYTTPQAYLESLMR
ncbi:MAG: type III-B CRISPR module RAMP protein Cmr1 [Anaerolineae bacterium]|nr:type III-B CRISPR module RAMP protein Cmr1 [Anaerolineae bacterium]